MFIAFLLFLGHCTKLIRDIDPPHQEAQQKQNKTKKQTKKNPKQNQIETKTKHTKIQPVRKVRCGGVPEWLHRLSV